MFQSCSARSILYCISVKFGKVLRNIFLIKGMIMKKIRKNNLHSKTKAQTYTKSRELAFTTLLVSAFNIYSGKIACNGKIWEVLTEGYCYYSYHFNIDGFRTYFCFCLLHFQLVF